MPIAVLVVSVIEKMAKINITCPDCEADYTLSHDMEERRYAPQFCLFCGEEIEEEDEFFMEQEGNEDYDE